MKRAGKTFSFPQMPIYPLFKKRTVPLRGNSYRHNYFIDGKQIGGNVDIPDWHKIFMSRKIVHAQEKKPL